MSKNYEELRAKNIADNKRILAELGLLNPKVAKMSKNYEELRAKNIADNKRILAELGLLNPFQPLPKIRKTKIVKKPKEEEKPAEKPNRYVVIDEKTKPEDLEGYGSVYNEENTRATRKSSRLRGKKVDLSEALIDRIYEEAEEEMEERREKRRVLGNRPMVYGPIPGVEVGTWWATRMECNHDGIHRPTVAGIHPGPKGAYSIALSGGYEDDIDMGDCFTYTGEGGRDLKGTASNPKNLRTAPQSKDQTLSRGNMALKTSSETNFPIRVIRGYKSDSPFAPEEGYRYDGLYKCEKAWYTTGMAGFGVWKFALRRIEDQAPPPWTIDGQEDSKQEGDETESEKEGLKEKVAVGKEKSEIEEEIESDTKEKVKKELPATSDGKVQESEEKEEREKPAEKSEIKEEKESDQKEKIESKKEKIESKKEKKVKKEKSKIKEGPATSDGEAQESKQKEETDTPGEEITEMKEGNNNDEGIAKSEDCKDTKPMKEIQAKEKGKRRKSQLSDSDDFDEDEDEPKKKKVKRETKKEKKEKENTAMSKGLMGWLIKTP